MSTEAPRRASVGLMFAHPAHVLAFGAGSGLSPIAPGTVGTLWGWVSFLVIERALAHSLAGPLLDVAWALILAFGWLIGCWAEPALRPRRSNVIKCPKFDPPRRADRHLPKNTCVSTHRIIIVR